MTVSFSAKAEKMYSKEYYENGFIKAEGWQMDSSKTGYWIFYHPNGKIASKGHFEKNKRDKYWYFYSKTGELEKEGHFIKGSAENWWIFYEIGTRNKNKFEYKNNLKNGYGLRYKNKRLIKVEKYINDRKEGEWTSISSFRRDNPNVAF